MILVTRAFLNGLCYPPSALVFLVNTTCAPLAPLSFLSCPILVYFIHVPEHDQAFRETHLGPNIALTVSKFVPLAHAGYLCCLHTIPIVNALFADPDLIFFALCFGFLRTAVCCG